MQIDKQQILDLLHERGQNLQAQQAEKDLPDQVDSEGDAELLERFGVNPADLVARDPDGGAGIPGL